MRVTLETMSENPSFSHHALIPTELIQRRILSIRGHKVMADSDLADLYQVETKALNRAVKKNLDRFPEDFMFQLTVEEAKNLRYQFGTSKSGQGGRRYLPLLNKASLCFPAFLTASGRSR